MIAAGVSSSAIEAVIIVSKQAGEEYGRFIDRIIASGNAIAILVKGADLADNLDRSRGPIPDSMRKKYEKALAKLKGAVYPVEGGE